MTDFQTHAEFVVGLFAMLDPLAAIPFMLALPAAYTGFQRRQVAFAATVTIMVVLLAFQYSGMWILDIVGTSLASLEIAGGIIIAMSGFAMMSASGIDSHPMFGASGRSPLQIGIVPIAVPLIAGPGAITKVLLEAQESHGIDEPLHISFNIVCVCLATGAVLFGAEGIGRLMGNAGTVIFNRLFGLVVTAIGVEIIAGGVSAHIAAILS
jgi:multiple antibiotic resistance protein